MGDGPGARSTKRNVSRKVAAICGTAVAVVAVIVAVKAVLLIG